MDGIWDMIRVAMGADGKDPVYPGFWMWMGFWDVRVGPFRIRPFEFGRPEPVDFQVGPKWPVCEVIGIPVDWQWKSTNGSIEKMEEFESGFISLEFGKFLGAFGICDNVSDGALD